MSLRSVRSTRFHICAYDSLKDMEQRLANMNADRQWQAFKETNCGSFVAQDRKILRGTPLNPKPV
ncbi:MAG: NIPSNAP family protein [Hylemonella sp.]